MLFYMFGLHVFPHPNLTTYNMYIIYIYKAEANQQNMGELVFLLDFNIQLPQTTPYFSVS